jgi:hypothetical protein
MKRVPGWKENQLQTPAADLSFFPALCNEVELIVQEREAAIADNIRFIVSSTVCPFRVE